MGVCNLLRILNLILIKFSHLYLKRASVTKSGIFYCFYGKIIISLLP